MHVENLCMWMKIRNQNTWTNIAKSVLILTLWTLLLESSLEIKGEKWRNKVSPSNVTKWISDLGI